MDEPSRPHLEAMRIVTGCTTAAQFVDVFHRFCDGKTLFIPTTELRPIGSRLAFSLRLADGTPMLRGACTVRDAWASFASPYKRPGVLLELEKLSSDSDAIVEQLVAQANEVTTARMPAAPTALPVAVVAAPDAAPDRALDDEVTTPNEQAPSAPPRRPSVALGTHAPATRAPHAPLVVPANPLVDMDDAALTAFLDCAVSGDPAAPVAIEQPRRAGPTRPPPRATQRAGTRPHQPATRAAPHSPAPTAAREPISTVKGMPPLAPPAKRAAPPPIPPAALKLRKKSDTKPVVGASSSRRP